MRHFKLLRAGIFLSILFFGLFCMTPVSAQANTDASANSAAKISASIDAAYTALRAGNNAEALKLFDAFLAANPVDADALVGAGFAALRLGDSMGAKTYLQKAIQLYPGYSDAYFGLSLALERLGDKEGAVTAIAKAVKLAPDREDFKATAERLIPVVNKQELSTIVRPTALQMGFRVGPNRTYQIFENGKWRSFFWKGIDLGAALPGKYPSQFPEKSVYVKWLEEIGATGFNVIRVYTIHPPVFYEALREYNLSHTAPLYLAHGVWAELPPNEDFLNTEWFDDWKGEMRRVIDLLHGHAEIAARPGHSSGSYVSDVSAWVVGIILGREWESPSVREFNKLHPESTNYKGQFVSCASGTPMETFFAEAMDYYMAYESKTYNAQRPVAFTNWPTLDPLHHISESTKLEEAAWKKKLGLLGADIEVDPLLAFEEDEETADMEKIDVGPANKAGLFVSYHAYPYYPDFLNNDAVLKKGIDAQGPNNYKAYLDLLVAHHAKYPIVISEFGVPSSRISAHWQPQGMTHGRHTEKEQGEINARLLSNIYESGCAGGVLFEWMDEWFKKNWLVYHMEKPLDRKPWWYNFMDAEENYGLIGNYPGNDGPSILIDGKAGDWAKVSAYLSEGNSTLKVLADEGWLHLGIFWPAGDATVNGYTVGINIDDSSKGSHKLPFGLAAASQAGLEFAIVFQGEKAGLFVERRYDLFTYQDRGLNSLAGNGIMEFVMPQAVTNPQRIGRDGVIYPEHKEELGWLRRGTQDRNSRDFDSLAEWNSGPGFIEARIPWGLLNVGDPSSRSIVLAQEGFKGTDSQATTDGFRLMLAAFSGDAFSSRAFFIRSLPGMKGGQIPLPPLFTWNTWEEPTWHEVRKQSYSIYKDALSKIPDVPKAR